MARVEPVVSFASSFTGFEEAARNCLQFLQERLGFSLWMVTRVEQNDWIVISAEDHGYGVSAGDLFRWSDSLCTRMVSGLGPNIAPNFNTISAYASAPIGDLIPISAYIGMPLKLASGQLFGTLCAIDPEPQPGSIRDELPLVEMVARLLTTLLDDELKRQAQARCADLDEIETLCGSLTGLKNRRGWDQPYDDLKHANRVLPLSEQHASATHPRLLEAIENIGEAFALYDQDDRLVLCNTQYLEYWTPIRDHIVPGMSFRKLCELAWDHGMVPRDRLSRAEWIEQRMQMHRNPSGSFERQLAGDRWVLITERQVQDGGNVAIITDITEQHRLQQELIERKRMLDLAEEIAHVGHWHFDLRRQTAVTWSDEMYHIYGLDKVNHLPTPQDLIQACHPDDRALVEGYLQDATEQQTPFDFELRLLRPDGSVRTVAAKVLPEFGDEGTVAGLFGVFQDITERKRLEVELRNLNGRLIARAEELQAANEHLEQQAMEIVSLAEGVDSARIALEQEIAERKKLEDELRRLATIDPLSGAYNRRYFMERGAQAIAYARRYHRSLSVLMLDIDHFKRINDTHGHAVGDEAIKAVAKTCQQMARQHDVIGRLGGEEFAVLLPETAIKGATVVAERLRKAIEAIRLAVEDGKVRFTGSIGVSQWTESHSSVEVVLQEADEALYKAKRHGRNRVVAHQYSHSSRSSILTSPA